MEVGNYSGGSLQIANSVLARIAKLAALEVEGVNAVRSAVPEAKSLLNKSTYTHARSVTVSVQDDVAEITVCIEVLFGLKIPVICSKVQESVKSAVQNMAGITVSKVNVVVVGVGAAASEAE